MPYETQKLTTALTDRSKRRKAAQQLARHLGADDLIIFIEDLEIGAFLPAPGFPQTIKQAKLWHDFVKECLKNGSSAGNLPCLNKDAATSALGIKGENGTVLILLGGAPDLSVLKERMDFRLPLLGALFRAEQEAAAAEGRQETSKATVLQMRQMTRMLEVTRAELQHALVAAAEANRLKDEFLATVSHELRTPLSAILGWAKILQTGSSEKKLVRKASNTIERSAKAQMQLIEDLIDVSRIIAGKFRIESRPVELTEVVMSAIDILQPTIEAKNIQVSTNFDPKASQILGDPDRLQQVVWNLLMNSIKFTPENGRIEVSIERDESRSAIIAAIRDTGIGIEPEFLPYIFDRFRQSSSTKIHKHGGLGLGLSIVRHLVEMHGGTVCAESAGKGKGAAFTVTLPIFCKQLQTSGKRSAISTLK